MYKNPETKVIDCIYQVMQSGSPVGGGLPINNEPLVGGGDAPARKGNPLNGQIKLN